MRRFTPEAPISGHRVNTLTKLVNHPRIGSMGRPRKRPSKRSARPESTTPVSKAPPGPRKPGRPRKDGLAPIQWKKGEVGPVDPITGERVVAPPLQIADSDPRHPKLIARIRYLAGRGLPPDNVSALTGLPLAHFEKGGMYYEDCRIGRAEANLLIQEALFEKALAPTDKSYVEKIFLSKCLVGLAETPAGRAKVAAEKDEDEVTGFDVEFVGDGPARPDLKSLPGGRGKKKSAA